MMAQSWWQCISNWKVANLFTHSQNRTWLCKEADKKMGRSKEMRKVSMVGMFWEPYQLWCSCSSWLPSSSEGKLYHSVVVWSDCYCMRPPKAGFYDSVYSAVESIYLWALKFNARSGCFAGNCTGLGQWFRKAFIWPEQIAVKWRGGGSGFPGTRIGPI